MYPHPNQRLIKEIEEKLKHLESKQRWLESLKPKYDKILKLSKVSRNWALLSWLLGSCCLIILPAILPAMGPYAPVLSLWIYFSGLFVSSFYSAWGFRKRRQLKKLETAHKLIEKL